jgi:uncharacterized membrane protein YhhN
MGFFLGLFALAALADWYAVYKKRTQLEYVSKPAALIFLILWFTTRLPFDPPPLGRWFTLGLALSLAGDVFLMLPSDQFLKGLAAFLLTHLVLIVAFNLDGVILTPLSLILLGAIGIPAGFLLVRILEGIRSSGRKSMSLPVVIYAVALVGTFWSTSTTILRPAWPPLAGFLSAAGGALFFISDAGIAWNRYVGPHPGGRILEMITYHLAQLGLASGVLLAISGTV